MVIERNQCLVFMCSFNLITSTLLWKNCICTKGKIQGAGGNKQKWNVMVEYFLKSKIISTHIRDNKTALI